MLKIRYGLLQISPSGSGSALRIMSIGWKIKHNSIIDINVKALQIYTIPGLGFDSRIFQNIHFENFQITHLEWKEPLSQDESIEAYAKRYLDEIKGEHIVLIGHSFGGVLSIELSRLIKIDSIFLISSIRHEQEMPVTFNAISKLKLYKLITPGQLAQSVPFWGKFYDYTSAEQMGLAIDMISNNTKTYLKWAVKTISNWKFKAQGTETNITQIHGSKDKTFPISKIKNVDFTVEGGGHFMVYKHGKQIGEFIQQKINSIII
ncbi:MAG: hypothetical protein HKN09_04745 [Saprospiraceae bacterium]|nr:hypothetical protein [Saprospiraceae bacterium]